MKHILKKIGAVAGIIPVAWYCYEIQGKYMDTHTIKHQNAPSVLDDIQTAADALGLFPRTEDEMKSLVERIKISTHERLAHILALSADQRTFENTIRAYDVILNDLEKVMALLELSQMVYPKHELRTCAHNLNLELSNFSIDTLTLNKDIYAACIAYVNKKSDESLTQEERFYLDELMKDFKRAGFELPEEQQEKLKELNKELAALVLAFETNIAQDLRSLTLSADDLAGLNPEQSAPYQNESGSYTLKTDYPTMDMVLQNCRVESTRKALWKEFNNRAHPTNSDILKKVIALRHEIATLLGYGSHTAYSLEESMAESPERVEKFLKELEERSAEKALQEFKQLTKELPEGMSLTKEGKLKPWDAAYLRNYYKKTYASIDEQAISEYFPLEKTIDILLQLYEEFLGLTFEQIPVASLPTASHVWHPDVKLIKATQKGVLRGYLFLDLHPRDNKYTHACHGSIIHGLLDAQGNQKVPAVSLVIANFPKSTTEKPALLMRNDVNTFFHEFGHAVHALCGATQMASFSGTKTKRDFVELPSQMLEEWLWQPEVLKRVSGHYQSGLKLHDELIAAIMNIKNMDTGFFIRRQLSLAYLSLACFNERIDDDMKREYEDLFNRLMPYQEYCPEENFIASFGHLMGYGARYYGYLWSKVFALDLFDYIKAQGLSPEVGARYRELVIGKGGSKPPMDLLRNFLGREPQSDAFFRDMGI